VAGGPGGRAGSGKIAALLAGRPAKVGDLLVPSTAPAFEQLTDLPQYRRNLESHCQARVGVQKVLRREFAALLRKHVELAVQYRMRYEAYKAREAERAAALREQLAAVERAAAAVGLAGQGRQQSGGLTNAQQPLSPTARTTSRGRSGDYIRSDWEEKQAIATLQAIELVKHCCELPRMEILPPRVARWEAYEDRNRLISDPEADEEASWYVRPWTEEERKVFADKFLLHHKASWFGLVCCALPWWHAKGSGPCPSMCAPHPQGKATMTHCLPACSMLLSPAGLPQDRHLPFGFASLS
jgi:hypothetical protein